MDSSVQPMSVNWPTDGQAAVGLLGQGLLASSPGQTPKPTASVAKTMLALSVLTKYPLAVGQNGPMITITPADVAIYNNYLGLDGSVVKVAAGERINEYQALQAIMLPSSNNMADSLAIWAFGSMAAYLQAANQLAAHLGMAHSFFGGDASGFLPVTTATASDLVLLGRAAISNPLLKSIVCQPSADLPVAGLVRNYNPLLGTDGVIGIKTGNSDQAGGVLLLAASRLIGGQSFTMVIAIDGQPTLAAALAAGLPLLNSAYGNISVQTVIRAGQTVALYKPAWQTALPAVATRTVTSDSWRGKGLLATDKLRAIAALPAGQSVGTVSAGGNSSAVVLATGLRPAPWWWRLVR